MLVMPANIQCRTFCYLIYCKKNVKIRISNLPVVLYGCETWSLMVRVQHRLRVFENRVFWRIFGPKRNQVKGG
jgi:hypothetical protein